jgi:hypothetical protein
VNWPHLVIAAVLFVSLVNLALIAVMLADVLFEYKDRRNVRIFGSKTGAGK